MTSLLRPAAFRSHSASSSSVFRAPAAQAATAVSAAKAGRATDSFGYADVPLSQRPLGPAVRPPQLPAQIEAMSPAELKGFSGEQVLGMTRDQFRKFQNAVLAEGGPGVAALDPQVRKALLRKGFLLEILDMCRAQQEKHAFCAW